jgi:hypothetical protein
MPLCAQSIGCCCILPAPSIAIEIADVSLKLTPCQVICWCLFLLNFLSILFPSVMTLCCDLCGAPSAFRHLLRASKSLRLWETHSCFNVVASSLFLVSQGHTLNHDWNSRITALFYFLCPFVCNPRGLSCQTFHAQICPFSFLLCIPCINLDNGVPF